MKYQFTIFFCLTIVLLIACRLGKSNVSKREASTEISVLAWNEDTINSYQFVLTQDKKFIYTVTKNDSIKNQQFYYGTVINQSFSDTLFLKYKKNIHPFGAATYLITEASQGYLIQQFENGTKSVFMRLQRLGHRF